uniref:NADH dehydrogenase subunit 4L n=1 Tax=Brachionus plicatilis TaxID=10195 RepID=B1GYK5_BRAPC|nr:NADH dehydrogenase subunit 4L [Brachionus plicatilis]BAG12880.1 NADH dehydrogenase subunit 4L [Brachionus plicatilis]
MMTFLFALLTIIFLYYSSNLLLSLLVLEMLGFMVLFYMALNLSVILESDFLILSFFSVFVMEGVIALSGLIMLVSFTGSDYVSSSSFSKL